MIVSFARNPRKKKNSIKIRCREDANGVLSEYGHSDDNRFRQTSQAKILRYWIRTAHSRELCTGMEQIFI